MLYCIYSNELPVLKQVVVATLRREPLSDPFHAEQILVPGTGLAQWLKLSLADELGVSANIDFPMPSNFLWRLFHAVLDDVPKESDFNKEVMLWHLLEILPALLEQEEFATLRNYLKDSDALRAYQLAAKIADIFDQYLLYRIDWINDWSQGGNMAAESQAWQPVLWRALCERIEGLTHKALHRAGLFEQFCATLKNEKEKSAELLAALPERLFIFGFNSLPPIYLEALQALSAYRDIYLLVANPCRIYWGDLNTPAEQARLKAKGAQPALDDDSDALHTQSHALLASLGKQGREFLGQLQALPAEESDYYIDPGRENFLKHLQQDILDGLDRSADLLFDKNSQNKVAIEPDDFSISFHDNYSPLREVEVLHDQLLNLFEQHASLTPKDIVVMVPDIDRYSPLIHAVFDSAKQIPFSVADRSVGSEEPLLLRVKTLLQLPASRLSVSEVMELLELGAIRERFKLSTEDMDTLNQWVTETGIRWGMDGQHRSALGLPGFEQNSWRFGLNRMLAGFSMGGQSVYQGIASYDEVNGLTAVLVGKLATLLDRLNALRLQLSAARFVDDWIILSHQLVDDFFDFEPGEELALQPLWNGLERLKKSSEQAHYSQALPHSLFVQTISASLSEAGSSSHFLNGQVSFCTLLPKRAIPFKVVCVLGMNEGDYPVSPPSLGFDLMAQNFREGDRSRRDEERFLFLEALLAAEKKMYLSWVGRNSQDNSEKQPSVLLSELMEYCLNNYRLMEDGDLILEDSADKLRQFLITRHPLQAFSADNFTDNPAQPLRFSYAKNWLPESSFIATAKPSDQNAPEFCDPNGYLNESLRKNQTQGENSTISLIQLKRFFSQPCHYYMQHHLQVNLALPHSEQIEHEPFVIDGLSHYLLKNDYLENHLINTSSPEDGHTNFAAYQLATGLLPTGFAGEKSLALAEAESDLMIEALSAYKRKPQCAIEINLAVGNTQLEGWLDTSYEEVYLDYQVSSLKGKAHIASWINHLALCATDTPDFAGTRVLGIGKKNKKAVLQDVYFAPIPAEQALLHLAELIDIFHSGQVQPLPFFTETAWQWASAMVAKNEEEPDDAQAWSKAQTCFYGDGFSPAPLEAEEPSIARFFPYLESVEEPFKILADRVFAPLLHAMMENKEGAKS